MNVQVIHADSRELASLFGDFDVQITDFPYSEHVHSSCASVGTQDAGSMGAHARDLGFPALSPELRATGVLCASRVKRWSVLFSDWQSAHLWDAAMSTGNVEPVRWVPWRRWSQPQLSGDRPCTGSEAVLIYHAARAKARGGWDPIKKWWTGPGSCTGLENECVCRDLVELDSRALRGQDKHPTEKPLDLLLDLVSWFSDPGESVIDLCGGAATTAQACRLLRRSCLAVELSATWAAAGAQRVAGSLAGTRDAERAARWVERTIAEASSVPKPKAANGSDVKTWERAQRRLEDAMRVAEALP